MEDFTMNLIAFYFIGYTEGKEDKHRGRETARLHDCKIIKF